MDTVIWTSECQNRRIASHFSNALISTSWLGTPAQVVEWQPCNDLVLEVKNVRTGGWTEVSSVRTKVEEWGAKTVMAVAVDSSNQRVAILLSDARIYVIDPIEKKCYLTVKLWDENATVPTSVAMRFLSFRIDRLIVKIDEVTRFVAQLGAGSQWEVTVD